MMGPLLLAAVRALDIGRARQRVMRPPHVASRFGYLLLWNGHCRISMKYRGIRAVAQYLTEFGPDGNFARRLVDADRRLSSG
jgi:hypothetical protein